MGIEAVFAAITPNELAMFQADPSLAYGQILIDMSMQLPAGLADTGGLKESIQKTMLDMEEAMQKLGVDVSDTAKNAYTQTFSALIEQGEKTPEEKRKFFSLHKDWHVLHYALNGTGEGGQKPLALAILGGTNLPRNEPVDYGPLRYLLPAEVAEVADSLSKIDPRSLIDALDQEDAKSKKVYLAHRMDDRDEWSHLPELFEEFRSFYKEAAKNGNAMLLKII